MSDVTQTQTLLHFLLKILKNDQRSPDDEIVDQEIENDLKKMHKIAEQVDEWVNPKNGPMKSLDHLQQILEKSKIYDDESVVNQDMSSRMINAFILTKEILGFSLLETSKINFMK